MIQECEAVIRIFDIENPSTIRDYLNAYFKQAEHRTMLGEKILDVDVWRDNDDVLIKIWINVDCEYFPGCKGSRWEPGEPPFIEGYFTIDDFIILINKVLSENFLDKNYSIEEDEDSYIPTEEKLLEDMECDYKYDEF